MKTLLVILGFYMTVRAAKDFKRTLDEDTDHPVALFYAALVVLGAVSLLIGAGVFAMEARP